MMVGFCAAGAALLSGMSLLAALALYAGAGALAMVTGVAVMAVRPLPRPQGIGGVAA